MDEANCPPSETLAAFIDQGLGATEQAEVEAHVADCDECRLLIAHVFETPDAVEAEVGSRQPVHASRPRRRLLRWTVGALVAAAAALLVTVLVQPRWWPGGRTGGADPRLADLADAVGLERTVEARLTGGFRHGPLRASVRSGGSLAPSLDNWKLYAVAGRIREDVRLAPTSDNLHALGLAQLLIGNYDDAVQALEDAIAEDAGNAAYQSDLAAAYLARAKQLDRPDDTPRALAAAERAVAADPRSLEAKFNRALALQSLFLEEPARRAWQDYLAIDASSPWAEEARRHLAELQTSESGPSDPARNNSPPPITDTTVEAGLDWVLRQGLPAWADAILAGDAALATNNGSSLSSFTNLISQAAGDPFPSSLAALPSPADPSAPAIARSLRDFAAGLQLIATDDLPRAEVAFRSACRQTTSAIALLCDAELGTLDVLHRADAAAAAHIDALGRARSTSASSYLEARMRRLEGFRALFQGDYATAEERYRRAFELADRAKYVVLAGMMASQIGDIYAMAGLEGETWHWRQRALQAAARAHSRSLRAFAWMGAGWDLSKNANHLAARSFLSAEPASRLLRVPALLTQARAALAEGDVAAAAEAIAGAESVVAGSDDFRAGRLRAEILTLKGTLGLAPSRLAGGGARDARIDGRHGARAPGAARGGAARARRHPGGRGHRPRRRRERRRRSDRPAGAQRHQPAVLPADTRIAQEAIAALIGAKADLQGARGLAMTDGLRQLMGGLRTATSPLPTTEQMQDLAAALPAGRAAIVFLFDDDSLLTWVVSRGTITFVDRPITRRDVERRVAALGVQVARSVEQEIWVETLTELHDLLMRDLPGLDDARDLLIVADGPLSRLPFGSLVDRRSGQFLFERISIRFAPSLTFGLHDAPPPGSDATVLAIGAPELRDAARTGLPPLPRARDEALRVAALYPHSRTLLGASATKARVLSELGDADVIHFAGHAVVSSGSAPRLLLAGSISDPSTGLSVGDLSGRLHGSRVVLAGCETATASAADRSSGRTHLATAFLRAGAASVVGSLWKVDDAVAEKFFTEVHRRLATGQPAAMAVAGAQRQCRGSAECRQHPATWIGATVYGMQ